MNNFLSLWRKWKQKRSYCCVLCHDSASDGLCTRCLDDLVESFTDGRNCCPLCFRKNVGGTICGDCQQAMPQFERMWASVYYELPISSMIHEFKHLADLSLARPLAFLMRQNPPDWLEQEQIDYVLPMPLSKERRLYRGFNQTEELVSDLIAHYHWKILPRNSVVRRHKQPQSVLKSSERLQNVKNVFKIVKPVVLKNRNILLIDDVFTTGATLNELAKTLKASGSGKVFCWSLSCVEMKR